MMRGSSLGKTTKKVYLVFINGKQDAVYESLKEIYHDYGGRDMLRKWINLDEHYWEYGGGNDMMTIIEGKLEFTLNSLTEDMKHVKERKQCKKHLDFTDDLDDKE